MKNPLIYIRDRYRQYKDRKRHIVELDVEPAAIKGVIHKHEINGWKVHNLLISYNKFIIIFRKK